MKKCFVNNLQVGFVYSKCSIQWLALAWPTSSWLSQLRTPGKKWYVEESEVTKEKLFEDLGCYCKKAIRYRSFVGHPHVASECFMNCCYTCRVFSLSSNPQAFRSMILVLASLGSGGVCRLKHLLGGVWLDSRMDPENWGPLVTHSQKIPKHFRWVSLSLYHSLFLYILEPW